MKKIIFSLSILALGVSTAFVIADKKETSSDNTCPACQFNGIDLYGKVQVVDAFPDIKVQVVDAFPDIKVQKVDVFPDNCGKWQFVDVFPDFKIQFVDAFPDIKIQYVDAFPGCP